MLGQNNTYPVLTLSGQQQTLLHNNKNGGPKDATDADNTILIMSKDPPLDDLD